MTPREEGRQAYIDWHDLDANPYDEDTHEFDEWEAGYEAQANEARDKFSGVRTY